MSGVEFAPIIASAVASAGAQKGAQALFGPDVQQMGAGPMNDPQQAQRQAASQMLAAMMQQQGQQGMQQGQMGMQQQQTPGLNLQQILSQLNQQGFS